MSNAPEFLWPLKSPYDWHKKEQTLICQNERPSSTRYCHAIVLIFEKETIETIRKREHFEDQKIYL